MKQSTSLRYTLIRTILIVSMLLLNACSNNPPPPLRIASSPWPGYEPLYLARDLGYLREEKVDLFELPSADVTMESFRNHSTDMATLTLDETLELLHDGTKLRILLILDESTGGDAVMVDQSIKTLSDIKGKRIAIVNIPLGLYMLNRLLDKANILRQDVTVFPMADTHQESFYRQGKADVVITYEPTKTRLSNLGMKVIFDSSDIPGEIFDLLVVHEDTYLQRKDDICEVAQQWFRTLDYMNKNPDDAAKRISMRLGVTADEFINMGKGIEQTSRTTNQNMLSGTNPAILLSASRLNQIMQLEGQLSREIDPLLAIDKNFSHCYSK